MHGTQRELPSARPPASHNAQASAKHQLEQQRIVKEYELRQKAKAVVVPTDDGRMRQMLRSMGEPVTLFGEREVRRGFARGMGPVVGGLGLSLPLRVMPLVLWEAGCGALTAQNLPYCVLNCAAFALCTAPPCRCGRSVVCNGPTRCDALLAPVASAREQAHLAARAPMHRAAHAQHTVHGAAQMERRERLRRCMAQQEAVTAEGPAVGQIVVQEMAPTHVRAWVCAWQGSCVCVCVCL